MRSLLLSGMNQKPAIGDGSQRRALRQRDGKEGRGREREGERERERGREGERERGREGEGPFLETEREGERERESGRGRERAASRFLFVWADKRATNSATVPSSTTFGDAGRGTGSIFGFRPTIEARLFQAKY